MLNDEEEIRDCFSNVCLESAVACYAQMNAVRDERVHHDVSVIVKEYGTDVNHWGSFYLVLKTGGVNPNNQTSGLRMIYRFSPHIF